MNNVSLIDGHIDELNEEQIVKALECHIKRHCWNDCPNAREEIQLLNKPCSQKIAEDALNLINRQKAEIERLKIRNKTLTEITNNYDWKFKKAKSEARKEFAERLTNRICDKIERSLDNSNGNDYFITDVYKDIDNLLKEMEGE